MSVSLAWNPDLAVANLAGYQVQYGTADGSVSEIRDVRNATSVTIPNLKRGFTYKFTVTAYDITGRESAPSNPVSFESGPSAVNATALLLSGTSVVVNVLANDLCPSGSPVVSLSSSPKYGSAIVNGDNTITYIPGAHFSGHDSFTYTLSDGAGGVSSASVLITNQGTFAGLISNASPDPGNTGRIQLQLAPSGQFTAKITIGTLSLPIAGAFNADGAATFSGNNPLAVSLSLDAATGEVTGAVTAEDGEPSIIAASFAPYSPTNPAPEAGFYTLLFPANPNPGPQGDTPQGTGFGRLVVAPDGSATITGQLADGTVLNAPAAVAGDGTVSIYAPLYGGKGFLAGEMTFEAVTTTGDQSDLDGDLEWQKPQTTGSRAVFPAGFATLIDAVGCAYSPAADPLSGEPVWPGTKTQVAITLAASSFPAPIVENADLVGSMLNEASGNNHIFIQIYSTSGVFWGSFFDPNSKTYRRLGGVVFQKRGLGAGFFLTPGSSGAVLITEGSKAGT
jgi:hypothetical protein